MRRILRNMAATETCPGPSPRIRGRRSRSTLRTRVNLHRPDSRCRRNFHTLYNQKKKKRLHRRTRSKSNDHTQNTKAPCFQHISRNMRFCRSVRTLTSHNRSCISCARRNRKTLVRRCWHRTPDTMRASTIAGRTETTGASRCSARKAAGRSRTRAARQT